MSSVDPTQGRDVGETPFEDPTQGREVGETPVEDPTQGRGKEPTSGLGGRSGRPRPRAPWRGRASAGKHWARRSTWLVWGRRRFIPASWSPASARSTVSAPRDALARCPQG